MLEILYGSNISWGDTGSMLSGLGTIGGFLAVIWASRRAFSDWRTQKIEERNIEKAERMLSLAIKLEDAFKKIRSQSQTDLERRDAHAAIEEERLLVDVANPIELSSRLQSPQITKIRLDKHQQLFVELFDLLTLSHSMRSKIIVDNLEILKSKYDEITNSANKLVANAMARKPGIKETREDHLDSVRDKHEAVIWSDPEKNDTFETDVKRAVASLKNELVDLLQVKS
jgi:hypothetical protein